MAAARAWRATVSGSFRRSMDDIRRAVFTLGDLGIVVLSPADPRVVDHFGEFLFVASDRLRTIRLVQQRHLAAIEASDFLWLVAPDGYVGNSASLEIGFALAVGTPVFGATPPSDLTLRNYVEVVSTPAEALGRLGADSNRWLETDALLNPESALQQAHDHLEVVQRELVRPSDNAEPRARRAAEKVRQIVRSL
jgi:hypothetical protein